MDEVKRILRVLIEEKDLELHTIATYVKAHIHENTWVIGYLGSHSMSDGEEISYKVVPGFLNLVWQLDVIFGDHKKYSELDEETQVIVKLMLC